MSFHVYGLAIAFFIFGIWNARCERHTRQSCVMGGRIFQEGISIVAVDVFVFISGWFSIKPKLKSICSFLFQVAFLKTLSYVIFVSVGLVELNKETLTELLMLESGQGWFVKAYLLLYIISPVLNTFVQHTSKDTFKKILVAYWSFLFLLGWVFDATRYINGGYSIVSFVGLYLLARYVRVWNPKWAYQDKMKDIGVYALFCLVFFGAILIGGLFGIKQTSYLAFKLCSYVSPLTVIGAISLLLFFSKLDVRHNRFINLCGKSCFSVYLLHAFWGYWFKILSYIDNNYRGTTYVLLIFSFLLIVYFGCILIDMLRIEAWRMVERVCLKHRYGKQ